MQTVSLLYILPQVSSNQLNHKKVFKIGVIFDLLCNHHLPVTDLAIAVESPHNANEWATTKGIINKAED